METPDQAQVPPPLPDQIRVQPHYYRPSGAVDPLMVLTMALAGFICVGVLAPLYVVYLRYLPWIVARIAGPFAFGGAMGLVLTLGAKWGKARNSVVTLLAVLGIASAAHYVHWITWIWTFSDGTAWLIFPWDVLVVMWEISKNGAWSMDGTTYKGWTLLGIWAAECLVVILTAVATVNKLRANRVFCERCDRWLTNEAEMRRFYIPNSWARFKDQLEQAPGKAIYELEPAVGRLALTCSVKFNHCSRCNSLHTVSVDQVHLTVVNGRDQERRTPVAVNLIIPAEQHAYLQQLHMFDRSQVDPKPGKSA